VKYHYGSDDLDALEKLQYEVYYLRKQGIGLDLRIVARTVRSVVARDGR
jgi:lipopolysaccharide/colanic/teichoic acid biosynthesis glycosyltransferase